MARRTPQQRQLRRELADNAAAVTPTEVLRLLFPAGKCSECGLDVPERIVVKLIAAGSGPGWSRHTCLPCARVYAMRPSAPAWLAQDLAAIDATRRPKLRIAE